jgi:hypothetical protein
MVFSLFAVRKRALIQKDNTRRFGELQLLTLGCSLGWPSRNSKQAAKLLNAKTATSLEVAAVPAICQLLLC